MSLPNKIMYL